VLPTVTALNVGLPGSDATMAKDTKDYPGAARFVPGDDARLPELAEAARSCQGCDLYERATQTVFGRGAARAAVVLIGEQPGDAEDRAGEPFVGPAGRLLDRALEEAGICPGDTYTTNAVKHFRWERRPARPCSAARSGSAASAEREFPGAHPHRRARQGST
jgi:uracil-DNA glycosylase